MLLCCKKTAEKKSFSGSEKVYDQFHAKIKRHSKLLQIFLDFPWTVGSCPLMTINIGFVSSTLCKSSNIVHTRQKWPENNWSIFRLHSWGTKHYVKFHESCWDSSKWHFWDEFSLFISSPCTKKWQIMPAITT